MPLSRRDENSLKKRMLEYVRKALTDNKILIETLKSSQYVSNISPKETAFNENTLKTALDELNQSTETRRYKLQYPERPRAGLKNATFTDDDIAQMSPAEIAIYASIVIEMEHEIEKQHTQHAKLDQDSADLPEQYEKLQQAIKKTTEQLYPTIRQLIIIQMKLTQILKPDSAFSLVKETNEPVRDLLKKIGINNKDIQLMPSSKQLYYNQVLTYVMKDIPLTKQIKAVLKQQILAQWNTQKPIYQTLEKMRIHSASRPDLRTLHDKLYQATVAYFNSPQKNSDKIKLEAHYEIALKESINSIKEHKGFLERLGDLLYYLGAFLDSRSLKAAGEDILNSNTKSVQMTKNFRAEIEKVIPTDENQSESSPSLDPLPHGRGSDF